MSKRKSSNAIRLSQRFNVYCEFLNAGKLTSRQAERAQNILDHLETGIRHPDFSRSFPHIVAVAQGTVSGRSILYDYGLTHGIVHRYISGRDVPLPDVAGGLAALLRAAVGRDLPVLAQCLRQNEPFGGFVRGWKDASKLQAS